MVYNSILEALGNTPMIRLNHINPPTNAEVLVKLEGLNVGGSIKTRTAYQMIKAAEDAGVVGPGSIIVEPTSGNQGIGLALVGAVRGYRTIIVMPDSVSIERRKLVQHYGAEVVLEGIEQPGYEAPSLAPGERAPLLTEKITHCDVSLTEGYGVTF